ncbi:NAD(P)-binding protein [Tuber magnatum]|uniref:NAD(P)-binding protein n=1 Tax=Tuber magnatum TaxID=42249 RepID=A0A317SK85_9PEZI|nr:NAD(P)-binding protein [Tuber magnatum]
MPCHDKHICTDCDCDDLSDNTSIVAEDPTGAPNGRDILVDGVSTGVTCEGNLVEVPLIHDLVDGCGSLDSIREPKFGGVGGIAGLPKIIRNFSLVGKVCVVTGGARGLGYNMTEGFLQAGARGVAILDILEAEGNAAAKRLLKRYDTPVLFYKVDITNDESVERVFSQICKDFGHIDVLLCSAGIADSNMPAETYSMARFRRLMDINVNGLMKCSQEAGKQMIKQRTGGSIILVASMSSHIVNFPQEQCCYNASKAAVRHLGASLALEWSKYGIRVNSISPGYMDTELNRAPTLETQKAIWCNRTPMKRLGHEDELNNLALFLASSASSFMTGADVIIDGGYCLP